MKFEWDPNKESENIKKHKIDFEEAVQCFLDVNGFTLEDIRHSTDKEKRYYWIGKSLNEKIITVRFTLRDDKIRIIGATEWREFRRMYNEKTQNK